MIGDLLRYGQPLRLIGCIAIDEYSTGGEDAMSLCHDARQDVVPSFMKKDVREDEVELPIGKACLQS